MPKKLNIKRFNSIMKRETKNMDKEGRANYVQIMLYHALVYEVRSNKKGN